MLSHFETTPTVKRLIIAHLAIWFFLVSLAQRFFMENHAVFLLLGLSPADAAFGGKLWQLFTYMFIHAQGVFHIVFNMFMLWMFGSELERHWGGRRFFRYYLFCGAGSGLLYTACIAGYALLFGGSADLLSRPMIGASGAIFGLLLAYGIIYAERTILFLMIFPIKARTFIWILAALELASIMENGFSGPVANLGHLGGFASGFALLKCGDGGLRGFLARARRRAAGLMARLRSGPRAGRKLSLLKSRYRRGGGDDDAPQY